MLYRDCVEGDFAGLLPLLGELWPGLELDTVAMERIFREGILAGNRAHLCAESDGQLVGYVSLMVKASLWQQGNLGTVEELVVAESCRGKGIGKELIGRIGEVAKAMGCRRLELESGHQRKEAHRFYEGMGFVNRALYFSKVLD